MAKIIAINGGAVTIGTDEGGIKEVSITDVSYSPQVGDIVDVFENDDKIIVTKSQVASTGKKVSKTTYCLLAFFLGGFGMHHFYAGKIAEGVLSIIFFWTFVPVIIATVNFIVGICKQADAEGNIIV